MKMFMITWVIFCFWAIVGLFIAYATDQLKEAMEQWERERKAQAAAGTTSDIP